MTFPAEMFDLVLKRIACGESLRSICRSEGMPTRETFYLWLRDNQERQTAYITACSVRALFSVEDVDNAIEDLGNDPSNSQVNAARLRIDTIKWKSARLQPKIYGDRATDEVDANKVIVRDFTGKQPYTPGETNGDGATNKT